MAIKRNVSEAKSQLSALIARVQKGEEVIIGKAGKPVARLVAFDRKDVVRKPDVFKGKIKISEDFNELPHDFTKFFGG